MENFIIYLFKVSISIALFYGLHMLLLRNETFMKLRRSYFVFALIFSLVYPAISIDLGTMERYELPLPAYLMSEIVVMVDRQTNNSSLTELSNSITSSQVVFGMMLLGSMSLLIRFFIQLTSLLLRLRKSDYRTQDGCLLTFVENNSIASFSFFRWIVVNKENKTESQIDDIIRHEKAHSHQLHSIDVIAYQIFCILFWWNPFAWLLQKEMKLNLEYLADGEVQKHEADLQTYQYTLLQISIANTGVAFINNFNVSQLKKRITMMNKKRTSALWTSKFLLVVPLAMALVLGNVQCSSDAEKVTNKEDTMHITQNADGNFDVSTSAAEIDSKENAKDIYTIVEEMPRFPGGEQEMMKFIGQNLRYPTLAQEAGAQGRVIIRFTVDTDGNIVNPEVIRNNVTLENQLDEMVVIAYNNGIKEKTTISLADAHSEIDKEALRVVKMMPKWAPGKQNGKEVSVYFTLPILFRLK